MLTFTLHILNVNWSKKMDVTNDIADPQVSEVVRLQFLLVTMAVVQLLVSVSVQIPVLDDKLCQDY